VTGDLDTAAAQATDPSVWILLLLAVSLAVVLFVVREVCGLRDGPSVAAMLWRVLRRPLLWCWLRCVALFCWLAGHAATFWAWLVWGAPSSRRT
jgi:hypothetical protein